MANGSQTTILFATQIIQIIQNHNGIIESFVYLSSTVLVSNLTIQVKYTQKSVLVF